MASLDEDAAELGEESNEGVEEEEQASNKEQQPPVELIQGKNDIEDDQDDDEEGAPLLNYTRIFGSLPRHPANVNKSRSFTKACTCSTMGRVNLSLEGGAAASAKGAGGPGDSAERRQPTIRADPAASFRQQQHHVVAMGFQNGQVAFVDARTGHAVVPMEQLKLNEQIKSPVVSVSFDSTGTHLAAMDKSRMACIWEFKYMAKMKSENNTEPTSRTSTSSSSSDANVFSNLMSAFKGNNSNSARRSDQSSTTQDAGKLTPYLSTSSIQLSRISYPKSFGIPTCMVVDPSYKKKREKGIVCGFQDGRLILTKRGFFLGRTDVTIFQGTNKKNYNGIEAIDWRGTFLAWADASGIRLFDIETMTRIAHVDRPTGARLTLYPTISSLRPSLRFETNNSLLVAWGDCLLSLALLESVVPLTKSNNSTGGGSASSSQQATPMVKRRSVECKMAWELECVACGIVPLDADHVLVLGLVTPADEDVKGDSSQPDDQNPDSNSPDDQNPDLLCNDLEVQVVSKADGTVVYSNILPFTRDQPVTKLQNASVVNPESASAFTLLSSFALPLMEDSLEAGEGAVIDEDLGQVNIFSLTETKSKFVDAHLKWSLSTVTFDEEKKDKTQGNDIDDGNSVDSDDYGFIFNSVQKDNEENETSYETASPPIMFIASNNDAVVARVRDIDDAVAHALESRKSALALRRALYHKRRLRRFEIRDIVNYYLRSLLRISNGKNNLKEDRKPLSIRRLKLAGRAMPTLIGGDVELWEHWVSDFSTVPGAVFVLFDSLPVRDPTLPPRLYGRVLKRMLVEIDELNSRNRDIDDKENREGVASEAEDCFLNALTCWGPTNYLKEQIKLFKYQSKLGDIQKQMAVYDAKEHFNRRFRQTAAAYLSFPISNDSDATEKADDAINPESFYDTKQALFDIDELCEALSPMTPYMSKDGVDLADQAENRNSRVALDAMAKLKMMTGHYDAALRCFLAIGAVHAPFEIPDVEARALRIVNGLAGKAIDADKNFKEFPYMFVLQLIEKYSLHGSLLNEGFLSSSANIDELPFFALMKLVGLERLGEFLIEHCVSPQKESASKEAREKMMGTLPLDLVARQLNKSPRVLLWYLNLVFTNKPEVYVRFPNTAYPPRVVTDLHRRHFELCVEHAGGKSNSAKLVGGNETYKLGSITTPLLSFLEAALPLDGMRAEDVRRALQSKRESDNTEDVSKFALELAWVIEHHGTDTEEEACEVLDLYLVGVKSLTLAAAFAQRCKEHSSILWDILIGYCLSRPQDMTSEVNEKNGSLFGALLEAAALTGADLAKLVTRIPPGMAVEGLRPRLVAAVTDYRLKLKMHEAAAEAAANELVSLMGEASHRSRRGTRIQFTSKTMAKQIKETKEETEPTAIDEEVAEKHVLPKTLRTVERWNRHKYSSTFSSLSVE